MNKSSIFFLSSLALMTSLTACQDEKVETQETDAASPLVEEKQVDAPSVEKIQPELSGGLAYVEGVPGFIEQNTAEIQATVKSIDYDARRVVLQDDKGAETTLTVPEEAVNFDQVEQGDKVSVKYMQEMIVEVAEADQIPAVEALAEVVGKAEEGNKPEVLAGSKQLITATVASVDIENHQATLKFEDGSEKTVTVRPDVEISESQIGKRVMIQKTEAMALSVTKSE